MTIWDLGAAVARRWYVLLVGLLCTVAACFYVHAHQGVYFGRADVVFLMPRGETQLNTLTTTSSDVVMLAGAVAKVINGTQSDPQSASPEATIVGRGITDGYAVQLPDMGGQWTPSFDRPVLDIQVVGSDPQLVSQRLRGLVQRTQDELSRIQTGADVAPQNRVTAQSVPADPSIADLRGAPTRALAMTALLGIATTLGVVAIADRLLSKTRVRRTTDEPAHRRKVSLPSGSTDRTDAGSRAATAGSGRQSRRPGQIATNVPRPKSADLR